MNKKLEKISGGLSASFSGDVNSDVTAIDKSYYEHNVTEKENLKLYKDDEQYKVRAF